MVESDGFWVPIYNSKHYCIEEKGQLRALCGVYKGPGGTSQQVHDLSRCRACQALLDAKEGKRRD